LRAVYGKPLKRPAAPGKQPALSFAVELAFNGEWVAWTAQDYYAGSPGADKIRQAAVRSDVHI